MEIFCVQSALMQTACRTRNVLCEGISFSLLWIALGLFLFCELETDYFILLSHLQLLGPASRSLTTTDWAPLKGHSQNCPVFLQWYQRVDHPLDTIGSITKQLSKVLEKYGNKKGRHCRCKNVHYHLVESTFRLGSEPCYEKSEKRRGCVIFPLQKYPRGSSEAQ